MPAVLCVAAREADAEALSESVTQVPGILVVGLSDPVQATQMARILHADLIIAPHGTRLNDGDALSVPVLTVPENADPAEVLEAHLASTPPDLEPPAAIDNGLPLAIRPLQLRLGFYGTRGGVGTTTAAVTAAKSLAAQDRRVALIDAAQRGDPYLLMGLTPSPHPATVAQITVYPKLAPGEDLEGFDALIIDGGRRRWPFPARWITVEKPLSEADIARILG